MGLVREVVPAPVRGLDLDANFGFPQVTVVRAGHFVFVSGVMAVQPGTGERLNGTVASEVHQCMQNLGMILGRAGSGLERIVQVHSMIDGRIEYDALNRAYRQYLPEAPPARTVWSTKMPYGMKVQIDALALVGGAPAVGGTPQPLREVVLPRNPILNVSRNANRPHSPMVRAGGFLWVSGMTSLDPVTGKRGHGDVAHETRTVLTNMRDNLASAGTTMERIVKVNVTLADKQRDYEAMNAVYREFFPHAPPARTVIGAELSFGGKIEIECVALVGSNLPREVLGPKNAMLNVSRNFNLPHSPCVRAGDLLYVSGMVCIDPATGQRTQGTTAHETRQILSNMQHLLESAGSSLARVAKVHVFIGDMLELENMNEVFREFFGDHLPARTVGATQPAFGSRLEIECIALAGN